MKILGKLMKFLANHMWWFVFLTVSYFILFLIFIVPWWPVVVFLVLTGLSYTSNWFYDQLRKRGYT